MTEWCHRGHLMVRVSAEEDAALVHVFEADASECDALDAAGGMIDGRSDKD